MNKISFIFVIVVASASCYDFLNGNHLFELPINRFKRAAQGPQQCCGNDFSDKPIRFLGEVIKECLLNSDPKDKDLKTYLNLYICVGDCVATKEGTVQKGEVHREKVVEFLRSFEQDEYRKEVYEHYMDKCISEAKEIQKRVAGKIKCDSTAVSLMRCLDRELLENCPEDKQNVDQEETCGQIKQAAHNTIDQFFQ